MTSKPLRVGIIGCGNISRRLHLPNWLALPEHAEVVALADPAPEALESARVKAGLRPDQVHAEAADLIARADVDAVDVCTPQHLRRDVIIAAARAGKHVLCEKPLAAVPADAAAAVAAAEENGVIFGMVHNYAWLPEIRAARAVIESGEIGDVRSVAVNFLGVVYVPGAAGDWRTDPAMAGGGVLIDMLHGIYLAETLIGEKLERVSAFIDTTDPSSRVEDTALCRFETATKSALVNIAWGRGNGGIEVTGSKGRVSIRYQDGATAPWAPLASVTVSTDVETRTELGPEAPRPETYDEFPPIYDCFHLLLEDFVAAVRDGRATAASGADGLRILEATIAAYESGATGLTVPIPLDRSDPVFLRGALGVRDLPVPPHSPLLRSALFTSPDIR
jgi:predicted dehydrogenase